MLSLREKLLLHEIFLSVPLVVFVSSSVSLIGDFFVCRIIIFLSFRMDSHHKTPITNISAATKQPTRPAPLGSLPYTAPFCKLGVPVDEEPAAPGAVGWVASTTVNEVTVLWTPFDRVVVKTRCMVVDTLLVTGGDVVVEEAGGELEDVAELGERDAEVADEERLLGLVLGRSVEEVETGRRLVSTGAVDVEVIVTVSVGEGVMITVDVDGTSTVMEMVGTSPLVMGLLEFCLLASSIKLVATAGLSSCTAWRAFRSPG